MEDIIFTLLALFGLFSHAVPLSIRNPYVLPRNRQPPSNYKATNWHNDILYDPSSDETEQRVKVSPSDAVMLPESVDELRRWWSSMAAQQRGGVYPDNPQVSDLGAPNSNFEEDFAGAPQDYNYFYGSDQFSEPLSSDEAFRQALKAYILPGNPFLMSETVDDDNGITRNTEHSPMQRVLPNDQKFLPDLFFRSYPHEAGEIIKNTESKKQNLEIDPPVQKHTDSTSVPLPATEAATLQTPVSVGPSVFPPNAPVSKAKGQKEFAMLRPPSDSVQKFDQWAKSAQDFMKSVASAAVRETREVRPVRGSKTEDTLPQQLSSLKRRSKRHLSKKFRDQTMWYY